MRHHDDVPSVAAVILSGGKSSRMKFPKAFLPFGQVTLSEHIIHACKPHVEDISVVLQNDLMIKDYAQTVSRLQKYARIIINPEADNGRFSSIQAGVRNIPDVDFCFLINTDNPVKSSTYGALIGHRSDKGYSVPVLNGKSGHPVLLSRSVLQHLRDESDINANLRDILLRFPVNKVEVNDHNIFLNLNTPADYKKYLETSSDAALV